MSELGGAMYVEVGSVPCRGRGLVCSLFHVYGGWAASDSGRGQDTGRVGDLRSLAPWDGSTVAVCASHG